ncbi:putative gas vesicle synthesis protein, GvpG-like [Bradyrhizobium sp. ORS 278]|uniref:gas vesicle protein GvpG n=1 Tax=Bradyrhizobium sp. (strain ORS 278) TaxID=114615 RepID=UPI0001507D27|nr:gas vesicle protein GvpG [Bradyrhizobium sp. ORS 278]CAL75175.1 putative gas vesicle synthesis protein, GvpG-like [Bradyrhizobium sp. ORS 278]
MLFKLLTAPVLGPLNFVEWVGEKIDDAVQAQMDDTEALKQHLAALEQRLLKGELTEEEFETIEIDLVRRLQAAAERMAAGEKK